MPRSADQPDGELRQLIRRGRKASDQSKATIARLRLTIAQAQELRRVFDDEHTGLVEIEPLG